MLFNFYGSGYHRSNPSLSGFNTSMKTKYHRLLLVGLGSMVWVGSLVVYSIPLKGYQSAIFKVDRFTIFLRFIPIIFFVCFLSILKRELSLSSLFSLMVSLVSSLVCFNTKKMLVFWVFYELSILPLLLLLFIDSPYSERFLAS